MLLVGIAVRASLLNGPMAYDEAFTYLNYANRPVASLLSNYSAPNNHLLHSLLAHFAIVVFGTEPPAIRLVAFVCGCLLPFATYVAGARVDGRAVGLGAASLAAAAPLLVGYSVNARGYTLLALLALIAFVSADRIRCGRGPLSWIAFVVASVLGFHAVPVMLYAFGSVFTWLTLSFVVEQGPRRRTLQSVAVAGAATVLGTVLVYVPVLAGTGLRSVVANEFVVPGSESRTARIANLGLDLWTAATQGMPGPMAALFAVGLLASLLTPTQRPRGRRVPFVLAAVLFCVPVFLVHVVPPTRALIALVPILLIESIGGLAALVRLALARPALGSHPSVPRARPWVPTTLALIAAAYVCLAGRATSQVSFALPEERSAEQVAYFAQERVMRTLRRSIFFSYCPMNAPLQYYFLQRKIPAQALSDREVFVKQGLASDAELFLVAGGPLQTREDVLRESGVDLRTGYTLERDSEVGDAVIYHLRRPGQ